MKKIVIVTGGTGGHIFPAIILYNKLISKGFDVLIIADKRFLNFKKLLPKNATYKIVPTSNLNGGFFSKILGTIKIISGVIYSLIVMYSYKPKIVVSFGGYVSFPTMIASKILSLPLIVHEQNMVLGKVSRVLIKWIDIISSPFKDLMGVGKHPKRLEVISNPVKAEIIKVGKSGYPILGKGEKINILIMGGSQGAKILSNIVPEAIINLDKDLKENIKIFQQCREEDVAFVSAKYAQDSVDSEVCAFFHDIPDKLLKAHLVICRSGASTVSEIIASKRPAIFIPLAIAADNHQYFNAKVLSDKNAAWVIEEKEFTIARLQSLLSRLLKNPELLSNASEKTKDLKWVDSGESLLKLVESFSSIS